MAKVRTKKEHKKRVAKRNNVMQQERKKMEKAQKEFLMKLIDEEKQKGLFNNPIQGIGDFPTLNIPNISGPSLGMNEGPKL
jgi:hypothetical protein